MPHESAAQAVDFDFDFDFLIYGGHPAQTIQDWRAPRRFAASPTQPYKCGQYFKVKVKTAHAAVGAENFGLRRDKQVRRDKEVDFDFNILTAFIRLGRAGPVGAGCPP